MMHPSSIPASIFRIPTVVIHVAGKDSEIPCKPEILTNLWQFLNLIDFYHVAPKKRSTQHLGNLGNSNPNLHQLRSHKVEILITIMVANGHIQQHFAWSRSTWQLLKVAP